MNTIKTEPTARLLEITPDLALELLVNNNNNRPVTQHHVDKIAEDILAGRWQLNGSTIRIDKTGNILDGQHRLLAIEKSGRPVHTFLIMGLDRECFETIDVNVRSRKPSDVLGISGEKNVNVLAAALQWVCRYEKFDLKSKANFTPSVLLETLQKHAEIRESVRVACMVKSKLFPSSQAAFLHYIFARLDAGLAEAFVSGLIQGGYNPEKYPAFSTFYAYLVKNYTSNVKANRNEPVMCAVKAWNAERTKKPIKMLRVTENDIPPKAK